MYRGKFSLTPKNQGQGLTGSTLPSYQLSPIDISSSSSSSSDNDENDLSNDGVSNQLVLYDPVGNGNNPTDVEPKPLQCEPSSLIQRRRSSGSILPSIGAFTVQCASCFKWRLIPTKEKYEEIREHILEKPFVCQNAREWRPDVSCDDPEDISQDESRVWAIDKPNIAQPPDGWQRLLRIRSEGSSKFADVYYIAPTGKRLRSMVEVQKFLLDHPEYITDGVTISRFSFQIPKPLQENYVRKRPKFNSSIEGSGHVDSGQVRPLQWIGPEDTPNMHGERPGLPATCLESNVVDPVNRPRKKQATKRSFQNDVHH